MPDSTNILGDIGTVITNGPAAASVALAIAAAGPINDYVGNCKLAKLKLQEASVQVSAVKVVTDAGDSANLTLLNKVLALLNGTSTPSTAAITDLTLVYIMGPGAASLALANAAAGPIMDYLGNVKGAMLKLQEAYKLIELLISVTDTGTDSTNKGLLQGINTALA